MKIRLALTLTVRRDRDESGDEHPIETDGYATTERAEPYTGPSIGFRIPEDPEARTNQPTSSNPGGLK